jgi:hypothetical protein
MCDAQHQPGFLHEAARIQAVSFPEGAIELHLKDGRQVKAPLERFPEIAALSP